MKHQYINKITKSGLTIYDILTITNKLYIPTEILEEILREKLIGISLSGLPLRTRSKRIKEKICTALGYKVPKSFKKLNLDSHLKTLMFTLKKLIMFKFGTKKLI